MSELAQAPATGLWRRVAAYWPVWLCALSTLVLGLAVMRVQHRHDLTLQRERVTEQLAVLRSRMEATGHTTFSPTLGLEAMVQLDGGISPQRFQQLISRAVTLVPYLRSVAAAPDDVVRHIYPLKGNEAVLNLDYRTVPRQWAQVEEARQRRQPLLLAPVKLVQGGTGIVQRTPVFLRDPDAPEGQRYWGVVSSVADLDAFMASAGLTDRDLGLELAVHQADADDRPGTTIWGSVQEPAGDAVRQIALMPGARWVMQARPAGGWGVSPWTTTVLATWAGGALVTLLIALMHRQSQQLDQSQTRFRSLAALASDWVWEQDEDLRFTYTSRVAEETGPATAANYVGHRRWESPTLVPGIDWSAHRAALERRESFRDFEYAQYNDDGSVRYISISGAPVFDARGRFRGYRGTGRNITLPRQAEAALKASQAELQSARDQLQAVLDAAVEVAIMATDDQDRLVVFNRGAERMLGYREDEVMGGSPRLWHLQDEIEAHAAALSRRLGQPIAPSEAFTAVSLQHGSDTQVWTLVRRDGSRLRASLTITKLLSRDGRTIGFVGIARDITAQLEAEGQLRDLNQHLEARVQARTAQLQEALASLRNAQDGLLRSEKMAGLGSLVAGVAHELNTPLGNCLTTASTLCERTHEISAQFIGGQMRRSALEAYLRDAQTASEILLRGLSTASELVTHFKQLSVDQTSEQRRRYALQGVVDDVLSLSRARWKSTPYRIETQIQLPRDLDGYPGPLGQVLSNLLHNALVHAFEGREHGALSISARPLDDERFELVVADDGLGMNDDVRRRAFDPFFTTKLGRGGTGLGLNIVYNIAITVMGGQVDLHSTPGEGSRFVFRLPYVAPQLRAEAGPLV